MSATVLNYGSINIDYVYRVAHFVQPGETLASQSLSTVLGGKGANQSAAVARAKGKIAHIGQVGISDDWCMQTLKNVGVDTRFIKPVEGGSGHAIIQVDDAGENAIILHGGANQSLRIAQLEAAHAANPNAEYLLLQNEVNNNTGAIEYALSHALKIVFNPAPMDKSVPDLPLHKMHTLILNQGEAAHLSGFDEPEAALDYFGKQCPDTCVIITLGAKGAVWQLGSDRQYCASPQVNTVDTTGAGDTFVGYFVAGLVERLQTKDNLQRACNAAALATTTAGAMPSIPALSDLTEMKL